MENTSKYEICWLISPSKKKLRVIESILSKFKEYRIWEEPKIGNLFSQITTSGRESNHIVVGFPHEQKMNNPRYFFSNQHKNNWMHAIREFLEIRINAQFDNSKKVIIKDQTAIKCTDIILNIFPEAKVIFLPQAGIEFVEESIANITDKENIQELLRYNSTFWNVTTSISLKAIKNHNEELKLIIKNSEVKKNSKNELIKILKFLGIDENKIKENSLDKIIELQNYKMSLEEKEFCKSILDTELEKRVEEL